MEIRIPAAISLLMFFFLLSCKHDPIPGPDVTGNPDPPDTTAVCDPDTVYFVNDVLPIFLSSCAKSGCHDAATQADGVFLGNYSAIITTGKIRPGNPGSSEVYEVITEPDPDKIMPPPPGQALSQAQIDLIYKWIQQGAKNNYCASAECDSVNVTFSGTIWPMMQANCTGCHSSPGPGGGILLDNYDNIKNNASPLVWGAINHNTGFTPMPQGGAKLSRCRINQFKRWIDLGMPNN